MKKKAKNPRQGASFCMAALLLLAITAGLAGCGTNGGEEPSTGPTEGQTQAQAVVVNPLTGEPGFPEAALGKRPVAVIINNAPAARPQWGLCAPDIVFEGLAEGGITRMMWLFANVQDIPKIGSLRSARHDFLEVAEGFDAIFVHWGGSVYAYDALKQRDVDDIDGMTYSNQYFYRDQSRNVGLEHTGCTDGERLSRAIESIGLRQEAGASYQAPFTFAREGEESALAGGPCTSLTFSFSDDYRHTFRYDAATGLYQNFMNDKPMTQDGGQQMAVKNVLLLFCPIKSMGDASGCIDMDLTGGSGIYAANGSYERITWKKGNTPANPLKLYAADGAELALSVGQSYIGLVPQARQEKASVSAAEEA